MNVGFPALPPAAYAEGVRLHGDVFAVARELAVRETAEAFDRDLRPPLLAAKMPAPAVLHECARGAAVRTERWLERLAADHQLPRDLRGAGSFSRPPVLPLLWRLRGASSHSKDGEGFESSGMDYTFHPPKSELRWALGLHGPELRLDVDLVRGGRISARLDPFARDDLGFDPAASWVVVVNYFTARNWPGWFECVQIFTRVARALGLRGVYVPDAAPVDLGDDDPGEMYFAWANLGARIETESGAGRSWPWIALDSPWRRPTRMTRGVRTARRKGRRAP